MVPLSRFRVVELGVGPVTGLATMVLADFGADVVKVVPKGGDPFRGMGSWPLWTRGKRIVEADLHHSGDVAALRSLIVESADAVLTNLGRRARDALGLDAESLGRPDLVLGIVSGFGEDGPYANYPAYEPVVAAKSGRMLNFAGVADRPGPNYAALQVGTHATAQSAAFGLLAALIGREATGHGFTFDTSLLRGMMPYEMGIMAMAQLWEKGILERPKVTRDRTVSMPTFNYHPVRTKDGKWLQLGNLLPHLLDNFFRASRLDAVIAQSEHPGDPFRWPRQAVEEFRDTLFEHMQSKTLAEWTDIFVADGGVASHPYQTTQEALVDADVTANGHAVERDGVTQLGVVANLTESPGEVGTAVFETTFDAIEPRRVATRPVEGDRPAKPLAGVTVVESATIIAAPLAAATLADLGARVIKIEPLTGDPFRSMFHGFGASKCNAGKECISLDLKSADGQRIAQSLAGKADIWIHNYRMGVPERLGIGYEQLSAVNPDLVYVSANGYGPNGPGARRPSTHPIPGAALGGVVWQLGGLPPEHRIPDNAQLRETARKLLRANEVNPDPNMSMVVATTALLGLAARRAHGRGQKVFVDMFGANAYANWDDFLSYEGKPERAGVDNDGYGLGPLHRLYRCADGWVFLMIATDDEWTVLRDELHLEVERDAADLEVVLGDVFAAGQADDFESRLATKGIGCVRADGLQPPAFLLEDEHCGVEELRVPAVHPDWGDYLRNGPMVRFSKGDDYPGTGAMGGATVALLEELGYSSAEIDALIADRTVGVRAPA
ncbi:MAG: CoA transferase [Gammaproteobacteria bacterium]|nr:CoA transferase [Gammaproteobacteria bacterium]